VPQRANAPEQGASSDVERKQPKDIDEIERRFEQGLQDKEAETMRAFPREIEEFEADLYTTDDVPKLLAPFFRSKGGEIEVSTYDDGDRQMEVEIDKLNVPSGATVSAIVDGTIVCKLQVNRGRLVLRSSRGDTVPAVGNGSVAEIRYNGEVVLQGTFRRD
jgi:hypothetical protein